MKWNIISLQIYKKTSWLAISLKVIDPNEILFPVALNPVNAEPFAESIIHTVLTISDTEQIFISKIWLEIRFQSCPIFSLSQTGRVSVIGDTNH